jgi:hypothetical protein
VRRGRADLWCAERHVATIHAEPARRAWRGFKAGSS